MSTAHCPKCGAHSENEEVCDACGAMISRIRERERALNAERDFDAMSGSSSLTSAPTAASPKSGRFTKVVLLLGIFAIAAFLGRNMFQPKSAHSAYVRDLDATSFKMLVLDGPDDKTWVVDFWAPWCGPCRQFGPEFTATAESVAPKAEFAKVNVDTSSELAQRYNIRGIPAVLIIRDGQVIDQGGGMDRDRLKAWVESCL